MSAPVKLYIYDLSNGMARQLSLQLTGRQIDGIWHTSVVVFDKEIFYGQGINITQPGMSPHGKPLRIADVGETAIDQDTFGEYLVAMREEYTADKYHLLDFNCNTFTNNCIEFLTGGSLPSYIKSLPRDFLSTTFGQTLRPHIDAMFASRRPVNGAATRPMAPPGVMPNQGLAEGLLQSLATNATMGDSSFDGELPTLSAPMPNLPLLSAPAPTRPTLLAPMPTLPAPPTYPAPAHGREPAPVGPVTAPMQITTNPASFHSLLRSHRAVVAFFTSATCGPCRMIEPVFEELANTKSKPNSVGFTKIDLSVGSNGMVAGEYQVRVTPTFLFFLDGNKIHEFKGVNAPELRTQVDLLIYQTFPPHAHASLSLPAIEAIPLNPILFTQVPKLDDMFSKFSGFIDGVTAWSGEVTQGQVKAALTKTVLPFLKASTATPPAQQPTSFDHWLPLTSGLMGNLPLNKLFPLVDIWRLALLNGPFAAWSATKKVSEGALQGLVDMAAEAEDVPRNYLLTVLRMVSNGFSNEVLAREMILFGRKGMTKLLIDALLHEDAAVRTAAASLGFNIAVHLQRVRVDKVKSRDDTPGAEEDEEWETEMVAAVLQAIEAEKSNEDTVHRLVACLALLLRLSPYTEQFGPLLDALRAKEVLGGCGVTKKDVRRLIEEVVDKLCADR